MQFTDRGHDRLWYGERAEVYRADFNRAFADYLDFSEEEFTLEIRAEYLQKHLDKSVLYALDEELLGQIRDFYDQCAKR